MDKEKVLDKIKKCLALPPNNANRLPALFMVRPPFVFFSSTRSELPAYLDLVAELRLPGWERFAGS